MPEHLKSGFFRVVITLIAGMAMSVNVSGKTADDYLCLTGLKDETTLSSGLVYFNRSKNDFDGTTSSELYIGSYKHSGASVDQSQNGQYHSAIKVLCSDGSVEKILLVDLPNKTPFHNASSKGLQAAISTEQSSLIRSSQQTAPKTMPLNVAYKRGSSKTNENRGYLETLSSFVIRLPDFPKHYLAECVGEDFLIRVKGDHGLEYVANFDFSTVCLLQKGDST